MNIVAHTSLTKFRTDWDINVDKRCWIIAGRAWRRAGGNGGRWGDLLRTLLLVLVCCNLIGRSGLAETVPDPAIPLYSSSLNPIIAAHLAPMPPPTQQNPHLLDHALYTSIATYRALDYFSTRRALAGGAHEVILPQWVVDSRGTFIAFEGLASASEIGGSIWLVRHGHRRMARAMNMMSIGLGVSAVVHNYIQPPAAHRGSF